MSLGGRNYASAGSYTLAASATLPVVTLVSTTAVRPRLYEFNLGSSGAPANQAARFAWNRISTTGTQGSGITPAPIDPGDPACVTTSGLGTFSVAPTAGTLLFQCGLNQQATYRWLANPGGELIMPATASNGIELLTPAVSSAWACEFTLYFAE
jgi:hypothetical protein